MACCDPPVMLINPADLIYASSKNAIFTKCRKLMVQLVSEEQGNYLRYGADRGAYIDGNDILSNGSAGANLIHIDPSDTKITLTKSTLEEAGFVTSSYLTEHDYLTASDIVVNPTITEGKQIATISVNGSVSTLYIPDASASDVVVEQALSSGVLIATIRVGENATNLYAPAGGGGGGGSSVTVEPVLQSGSLIARISVDGTTYSLFAPSSGGGGGSSDAASLLSADSGNGLTLGSDNKLYISLDAGEL